MLGAFGDHVLTSIAETTSVARVERFQRVLRFIDARLTDSISLRDLAAQACLSPFHFSRAFLAATGISPHRYLTERRIRAAQEMIARGESSLAQIALASGLGSQGSFTRAFRKVTGLTPGQFREQCRHLPDKQEQQETHAEPQDLRRPCYSAVIGS